MKYKEKSVEHTTSRIFMVEPTNFRMNEQTSVTNSFQSSSSLINYSADQISVKFQSSVAKLEAAGVNVHRKRYTRKRYPRFYFSQIIGLVFITMDLFFCFQCLQRIEGVREI